jgi:hypothetical protein
MRADGDHQRRVGVAQVVEAEAGQLRPAHGRSEDAVAEVVVVHDPWAESALVTNPKDPAGQRVGCHSEVAVSRKESGTAKVKLSFTYA